MSKHSWEFRVRILLLLASLIAAAVTIYLAWDHRQRLQKEIAHELSVIEHGEHGVRAVAEQLRQKLRTDLIDPTHTLVHTLRVTELGDRQGVKDALKTALDSASSDLYGVGVAFQHFRFFPYKRLFGPYFAKTAGNGHDCYTSTDHQYCYHQLEYFYDYTQNGLEHAARPGANKSEWFLDVIRGQAEPEGLTRPHFAPASSNLLVEFTALVERPEADGSSRLLGIAYAQYAYKFLKQLVNTINLGPKGYGMLITEHGGYLVHPQDDYVIDHHRTIGNDYCMQRDGGEGASSPFCQQQRESPRSHYCPPDSGSGPFPLFDPLTESPAMGFVYPVPDVKACLLAIVNQNELGPKSVVRQRLLTLAIATVMTGLFVGLFFVFNHLAGAFREWTIVALISLLFSGAIGFIWYIENSYPRMAQAPPSTTQLPHLLQREDLFANRTELPIVDSGTQEAFLRAYHQVSEDLGFPPPIAVPTGVFIQSIEFISSTNVRITGYLWQHYRKGLHKGLTRGFILPEADEPEIQMAYHMADKGGTGECAKPVEDFNALEAFEARDCDELIGWYFATTLRQTFAYDVYPFDRQEVWLRLWHKDFARNVILTPDLESYDLMLPQKTPGIEEDFVLPGWTITSSGFTYRLHNYNSDFGITQYVGQHNFPELYFNVHVHRQFLEAFISKFISQFVVASMIFAILLIGTRDEQKAGLYGFSAKDVVLGCAALFFVVIFEHTALRQALPYSHIMYIECFYFVMYILMMLVTINSLWFASQRFSVIQYRDNFIPKLLYWPLLTGMLLSSTIWFFY